MYMYVCIYILCICICALNTTKKNNLRGQCVHNATVSHLAPVNCLITKLEMRPIAVKLNDKTDYLQYRLASVHCYTYP